MDTFIGVENFYEYESGEWRLTDTAKLDLPEYIYDGYDRFTEEGYTVDEDAYLRYTR